MVEKSGRPGYAQIVEDLRSQIRSRALPPGGMLPSIAQLGAHYDVSASVVKAAISVLRTENLIVGQQGKGVFVREGAAEAAKGPEVAEQLAQIQNALADLADRLAILERAVFGERPS